MTTQQKTVVMPRGSILSIYSDGAYHKVSEHNRSEFSITPQRIESIKRMANGSLRKFFIADKQTFNVSWSMLPHTAALTVDGQWGAKDLKDFYASTSGQGTFNILVNQATDSTNQSTLLLGALEYTVSFTSASFTIIKRGLEPFWSVSLSMEEV